MQLANKKGRKGYQKTRGILVTDLPLWPLFSIYILHCKEPIPKMKIRNKYTQNRNCAATVQISTLICLWAIYIFPRSICLFCCRKYVDRSCENINRPQTHDCGNWDWGCAFPRKGIHKWDFHCSVLYCGNLLFISLGLTFPSFGYQPSRNLPHTILLAEFFLDVSFAIPILFTIKC